MKKSLIISLIVLCAIAGATQTSYADNVQSGGKSEAVVTFEKSSTELPNPNPGPGTQTSNHGGQVVGQTRLPQTGEGSTTALSMFGGFMILLSGFYIYIKGI